MKIIFSRKGFDTENGGIPSPIVHDNYLSLPIPTRNYPSNTSFSDLNLAKVVEDLSNKRIKGNDKCHNDPDLELGIFGQVNSAQSHLKNQKISTGDLFLFFGLFQKVEKIEGKFKYEVGSTAEHRIFGWLLIGKIINLGSNGEWFSKVYPKYKDHPHVLGSWKENNTIYLPKRRLNLLKKHSVSGFGKFSPENSLTRLSFKKSRPSLWKVPNWINPNHGGSGLSYHSNLRRWGEETLQTVGRGQEFVSNPERDPNFILWLNKLFNE